MRGVFYQKNIYGILGTIIVHLVLGILFMLITLSTDRRHMEPYILIELVPSDEELLEKLSEIDIPDDILDPGSEEYLNIAVNLSEMPDEEFNLEEYLNQIKNEMISDGELDENNFMDQWKQRAEEDATLEYIENDILEKNINNRSVSEEMAANYRGPTRVFYDLKGRTHQKLPLPIYKCQIGGKVVLEIIVSSDGRVASARVLPSESSTDDNCLYEAAQAAALNSKFNPISASIHQKGNMTYIFAAQ